jgi:hypothetical protein
MFYMFEKLIFLGSGDCNPIIAHQTPNATVTYFKTRVLQLFCHSGPPTLIECRHSTAVQCIAFQRKAVVFPYMGQKY